MAERLAAAYVTVVVRRPGGRGPSSTAWSPRDKAHSFRRQCSTKTFYVAEVGTMRTANNARASRTVRIVVVMASSRGVDIYTSGHSTKSSTLGDCLIGAVGFK